jgi:uncharacterized protein DUF1573
MADRVKTAEIIMKLQLLAILPLLALMACGSGEDVSNVSASTNAALNSAAGNGTAAAATNSAELGSLPLAQEPEPTPASRSRLKFTYLDIDLGSIYQETILPLSFPFVVDGPDPATITSLNASCGCTSIELYVENEAWPLNTPIPAGSNCEVRGEFNSAHYLNVKSSTVRLRGNALNLPLTLNVQAFIRKHFELSPGTVRFGQVTARSLAAQPVVKKVKVTSADDFTIKSWTRLPQGLEARLLDTHETREDGRHVRYLEITLTDKVGAGNLMKSIQAETSVGRLLEVQINANVVGPVRYAPEEFLKFGAVNQGSSPKRAIKILATSAETLLPEPKVEFLGPEVFSWKLAEKVPGKEWVVRFQLSADTPIGRHGGRLKISYPDDPDIPSHEINVNAMVRKAP